MKHSEVLQLRLEAGKFLEMAKHCRDKCGSNMADKRGNNPRKKRKRQAGEESDFFGESDEDEMCLLDLEVACLESRPEIKGSDNLIQDYEILEKIQEGSYGIVNRARNRETGKLVALKKLKNFKQKEEGLSINGLREITALKELKHRNILRLQKIYFDMPEQGNYNQAISEEYPCIDSITLVLDYVQNDLRTIIRHQERPFKEAAVKTIIWQLLSAVEFLHKNWYMHRDISPSNVLLDNKGQIKLADFGLCRKYGNQTALLTRQVVTLFYRAPELLVLTSDTQAYCDWDAYGTAIDIWSVGCIVAELFTQKVFFHGRNELDQLAKITGPTRVIKPDSDASHRALQKRIESELMQLSVSASGQDLLADLLCIDAHRRASASQALDHPWFEDPPKPVEPKHLGVFPIYR